MRKISILLSVLFLICMLSTTVFAENNASVVLDIDKTSVAVDDTFTLTVGYKGDTIANAPIYGTAKVVIKWDPEYVEFVSGSADDSTFNLTNATTYTESGLSNYQITYTQKVLNTETRPYEDNTFGKIVFKAVKAGSSKIWLDSTSSVYVNTTTTVSKREAAVTNVEANFTITSGSSEPTYPVIDAEETFTAGENIGGITATDDTKAISVFAKANKALEANSYGIRVVSGGKTYVFRGIAPVAENGVWAIKVVSPDGTFSFKDGGILSATSENITTFED